jgi:protein SCO1
MLLASLLVVSACGDSGPYVPAGLVRTPFPDVGSLSLPESTANGAEFAFRAQPGEFLLLYFGYTGCPDICPTSLADIRCSRSRAVAFATVDPDRDVDSVMTAYIHAFFPDGHGLRTDDPERLAAAATPLGVNYDVWVNDEGYVEVIHSAFIYVIDDQGLLRLIWPFGTEPEDIARDLKHLFKEQADA